MKKYLFVGMLLVGLAGTSFASAKENNVAQENVLNLIQAIDYSSQSFVKKPIFKGENYLVILFAFEKGQELTAHTIPIDAFVQILEGTAIVIIDGNEYEVAAGEKISLPKNLPHALRAKENFKMLLIK
ncbi:MAG: cupin domain-containing protein [Desulfobulbaceae bacterium]|nr:cupin domain-containing protein [Desulfobulbaceae bacterium]